MNRDALLSYLRIKNLRQHVDTEITFAQDKQLLLFAGENGHGKTTIFEAIIYALYGTPRKTRPRTTLDSMVRWGEDLEGLYVELAFTMGDKNYVIKRRFVQGRSEATLTENGTQTTNSSGEVTNKVSLLLGMDLNAFRNAVVSEQKELAGLTSMDASVRMKVISDITGIAELGRAAKEAKADLNTKRKVLKALGDAPDLPAARKDVQDAETLHVQLKETLTDSLTVVTTLADELEKSSNIEKDYQTKQTQFASAKAKRDTIYDSVNETESELVSLKERLDSLPAVLSTMDPDSIVPKLDEARETLTSLKKDKDEFERSLSVRGRLSLEVTESTTLKSSITSLKDELKSLKESEERLAVPNLKELEEQLADLTKNETVILTELKSLESSILDFEKVGGVCGECHQTISDEYKDGHLEKLLEAKELLLGKKNSVSSQLSLTKEKLTSAKSAAQSRDRILADIAATEVSLKNKETTLSACLERVKVLESDLVDAPTEDPDLEPAQLALASLQRAYQEAVANSKLVNDRVGLSNSIEKTEDRLANQKLGLQKADQELAKAEIPQSLIDQVAAWQEKAARLSAEKDLAHEIEIETVSAESKIDLAKQRLSALEVRKQERDRLTNDLDIATNTERVLSTAAQQASTQLRPALEGMLSSLLATMSGGVYTSAKLNKDFSVTVVKSGEERDLNTFSGGEKDLIGLALRLALAQTVASRNAGAGPGFLILDEILGSQDKKRQGTIFEALRSMKDLYPQIFIISHTDGSEDLSDVVYETTASTNEEGFLESSVVSFE